MRKFKNPNKLRASRRHGGPHREKKPQLICSVTGELCTCGAPQAGGCQRGHWVRSLRAEPEGDGERGDVDGGVPEE